MNPTRHLDHQLANMATDAYNRHRSLLHAARWLRRQGNRNEARERVQAARVEHETFESLIYAAEVES